GREIWIEKYRPQRLEEVVGHDAITERLRRYINQQDLPHLLFAGPAGTGKCVTGETPVLTNRGVEQIGSVVGDIEGFTDPDGDLGVATFDEGDGFEFVEPSKVFGKQADELIQVLTRDGNESTVTPEHRLLVIDGDGLSWTRAEQLQPGDRIARPLEAPLPEGDGRIEWLDELDEERVFVHVTEEFAARHEIPASQNNVGAKREVLEGVRTGQTDERIAERADVPEKTVRDYRRRAADTDLDATSTVCSLSYLRSLGASSETLREHVERIQFVPPNNNRSHPVEPPQELTTGLATLLGLALSEARIDRTRIKFYNTDEKLLEAFSAAARDTFGVDPKRGEQNGVPYRVIDNRTVVHYLRRCFAVLDGEGAVGSRILRASPKPRRAFLRAVFDAEGHVTEDGILEFTQKDGDVVTLLSYLLAGEGVPARRKTERKAATNGSGQKREYHVLYVSSASALSRFEERVGFTLPTKAERLAENAARDSNPNHDTVPVQSAVSDLCETLYLSKDDLLTGTLNPETPGRENYLADIERVLGAATEKVELAQEALETVQRLEADIDRIEALPAAWVAERDQLEPISVRRDLSEETGIRSDRLLEYARGVAEREGAADAPADDD
ncbi:Replication factor C small subunit, partial [Halobacteriales archaeon QS_1_68_44]